MLQLNVGREVQNSIVVPMAFSTEHDPQLVHITEGRFNCMQHELVPDYLRTKLELDIEKEHKRLQDVSSTVIAYSRVSLVLTGII